MGLWYTIIDKTTHIENMDIIAEFLDIWLQTRKNEDIDPGELAGVIDTLYETHPAPGDWILIEVKPEEIAAYITTYVDADGRERKMMSQRDNRLRDQYVKLIDKGHEPTPIIIAGAVDDSGEQGIMLIDGRHRTHAAIMAGVKTIEAYIPRADIFKMDAAILSPTPAVATKTPTATL